MLQLTDRAVTKVKQLMSAEDKQGYGLRVAVKGGGCSGYQYDMTYEKEHGEKDSVLEFDGLRVFVDAVSVSFVEDIEIDYVDSLQESGFKIHNPRSTGACGCGASFSM